MVCFLGLRNGNGTFELEDLLEEGPVEEIIQLATGGQVPNTHIGITSNGL